ncbi:hypothetical protein [Actinomadura gamaensis]|uniref:Secreted protein n=1 Tax=Actinomadura gamaensis TaxID=1763541 RepID=A0ABV9U6V8_9ACTN
MQLSRSSTATLAGLTAAFSMAALAAGTSPALADVGAQLSFLCTGKAGTWPVKAEVDGAVSTPGRGTRAIAFGEMKVSVKASAEDLNAMRGGDLGKSGTETPNTPTSGAVRLLVSAEADGASVDAQWPTFALTGTGSTLTGTGAVPALAGGAGRITLRATGLILVIDKEATGSRSSVSCVPTDKRPLATIDLPSGTRAPSTTPSMPGGQRPGTGAEEAGSTPECKEIPAPGVDPRYGFNSYPALDRVFKEPGRPPGVFTVTDAPRSLAYCVRAAGFSNIRKLGGAAPVAALTLLRRAVKGGVLSGEDGSFQNYREQWGYVLNETMPSRSSQLSLGFMPTTSVTDMEQVAPAGKDAAGKPYPVTGNLRTNLAPNPGLKGLTDDGTYVRALIGIRVHDVAVNGVPLSVGQGCRTKPTLLDAYSFTGNDRTGRTPIQTGSTFTGHVNIPAFSGCGTSEDLSPLLTASVSGPGNYVQFESGPWCRVLDDPSVCGSTTEPSTVTVRPGGHTTIAAGAITFMDDSGGNGITCDAMRVRMTLRAGAWQQRFLLGKSGVVDYKGCRLSVGDTVVPVHLTNSGTVVLNATTANPDGTVGMTIGGLAPIMSTKIGGQPCTIQIVTGDDLAFTLPGSYDNKTHSLTPVGPIPETFGSKTACEAAPTMSPGANVTATVPALTFTPPQQITIP